MVLNLRFEKASSAHEAAKEMVTLAEEGFVEKGMQFDAAWQEMLNHATNRVSDQCKEQDSNFYNHSMTLANELCLDSVMMRRLNVKR